MYFLQYRNVLGFYYNLPKYEKKLKLEELRHKYLYFENFV